MERRRSNQILQVLIPKFLQRYEATVTVGEEEEYKEIPIIAIPQRQFLLGLEIISQYKWEIN